MNGIDYINLVCTIQSRNQNNNITDNTTMTYTKQNFNIDDRVTIVKSNSILDNVSGTILGKMPAFITDDYIVGLDVPYAGQKAIILTEACLTPILVD